MKKNFVSFFLICALLVLPATAHDLFLKPGNFFVGLNKKISIAVLNGTFQTSEGAVAFTRLTDVSIVSPAGERENPKESDFTKNKTTAFLNFTPKEAGNYVVGLSTGWRENRLEAEEFNKYLVLEGIPEV
jgi:hypothetical protein